MPRAEARSITAAVQAMQSAAAGLPKPPAHVCPSGGRPPVLAWLYQRLRGLAMSGTPQALHLVHSWPAANMTSSWKTAALQTEGSVLRNRARPRCKPTACHHRATGAPRDGAHALLTDDWSGSGALQAAWPDWLAQSATRAADKLFADDDTGIACWPALGGMALGRGRAEAALLWSTTVRDLSAHVR